MITDFDDYMIHQAPVPVNQPSVTDRNFYDRYWFNGFDMEGFFSVKGRRVEVKRRTTMGTRDKSWGVRPMGEFEDGAPSKLSTNPGVYFAWAPLQFDGFCSQCFIRQEPDGRSVEVSAALIKTYENADEIPRGQAIETAEESGFQDFFDGAP